MSLEVAIQENTLALNNLIAFLQNANQAQVTVAHNGTSGGQSLLSTSTDSAVEEIGESAVNSEPSQDATPLVETAPVAEKVKNIEAIKSDEVVVSRSEAIAALNEIVTKLGRSEGRSKAYEILNNLGYEKFTEVKVQDYAKIVAMCAEAA